MAAATADHPHGTKGVDIFATGSTLDELVDAVDDSKILFGVIRTGQEAKGTMSRRYNINLTFKGPSVSQVKGSKIMAHKFKVEEYTRQQAKMLAQVMCEDRTELKELVRTQIAANAVGESDREFHLKEIEKVEKVDTVDCPKFELDMAADTFGVCKCGAKREQHSAEALKAGAEQPRASVSTKHLPEMAATPVVDEAEMLRQRIESADHIVSSGEGGEAKTAWEEAVESGSPPTAEQVVEIVRDHRGMPYNWALFKPSKSELQVENAGTGSIIELHKYLESKCQHSFLYGLCRVSFGTGKLRRAYVFEVCWKGANLSGVKALAMKAECTGFLDDKMGDNSFQVDATSNDDVSPANVVGQIAKNCIVDADATELSVSALIAAYDAEQKALKEYYAMMERLKREAKEAGAAAERADMERQALEAAEEQRRKDEEEAVAAAAAAAAAKATEAAAKASAGSGRSVSEEIMRVGTGSEDAWVLFEIRP